MSLSQVPQLSVEYTFTSAHTTIDELDQIVGGRL